jgi:hypothetical protein
LSDRNTQRDGLTDAQKVRLIHNDLDAHDSHHKGMEEAQSRFFERIEKRLSGFQTIALTILTAVTISAILLAVDIIVRGK